MELVGVYFKGPEAISFLVDDGEVYQGLTIQLGFNTLEADGDPMPKSEFRDLKHLYGVIGKFNPYAEFGKRPLKLQVPLTFRNVEITAEILIGKKYVNYAGSKGGE